MSEIKPALTAEEWAEIICRRGDPESYTGSGVPTIEVSAQSIMGSRLPQIGRPQALAALCLHNQPFGFTREDVDLIKYACIVSRIKMEKSLKLGMENQADADLVTIRTYRSLKDRIEALLPPREIGK